MAITGEGQIVEAFVKKLLAERNLDVTAAVIEDQANIDLVVRVHKRGGAVDLRLEGGLPEGTLDQRTRLRVMQWLSEIFQDKLVSVRECVADWAAANAQVGECLASRMDTIDQRIVITVVGISDTLELPNGAEPVSREERKRIAEFLNAVFARPR